VPFRNITMETTSLFDTPPPGISAMSADISGWLGIGRNDALEKGAKNGRLANGPSYSGITHHA